MKLLFIVRSTLFTVKGGDTVQVEETARELRNAGVEVDIIKANEKINYAAYDLLHFFNIIRPADILVHINRSGKPFVVSTILVNYAGYDKQQRGGLAGKIFKLLPPDGIEYAKTIYRCLLKRDSLVSISYLWKGQKRSIREILQKAKTVLVQSVDEYRDLVKNYSITPPFALIHNGVNTRLFQDQKTFIKEQNMVLCVARIEGIKNQYNLIKALNNTAYQVLLIGDAAPGQTKYYRKCKQIAADNISFISHLPQEQLVHYYAAAKVHVLPSWFEVCGLSSLEAAAMGCRVVISGQGYAGSYFGDTAFYCDPARPESIFRAVNLAVAPGRNSELQSKVFKNYTWKKTAEKLIPVYIKYIEK